MKDRSEACACREEKEERTQETKENTPSDEHLAAVSVESNVLDAPDIECVEVAVAAARGRVDALVCHSHVD